MKYILNTLTLATLLLAMSGCSDMTNPGTSEMGPVVQSSPRPVAATTSSNDVKLIKLPPSAAGKDFPTAEVQIDANGKGKLAYTASYIAQSGKLVSLVATLTIPENAVSNNVDITMTFDTTYAAIRFSPEGLVFRTPVNLDFTVTEVGAVPSDHVLFYYVDDGGSCELIPSDDPKEIKGKIEMKHAKLNHFSIYAFGR